MTIADLKKGEKGKIGSFSDERMAVKLLEMGCLPGVEVTLIQKAPFRGALYLRISDHLLAIRREEAAQIQLAS